MGKPVTASCAKSLALEGGEDVNGQGPIDGLVGRLIAMHNNPRKIGWMEQTTLREACETLIKMRAALAERAK